MNRIAQKVKGNVKSTHGYDIAGHSLFCCNPRFAHIRREILDSVAKERRSALLQLHFIPAEGDRCARDIDEFRLAGRHRQCARIG